MHEDYAYMSPSDIKRAAAKLRPLLDAVVEHKSTLKPTIISIYEPRPLPSRLLSTAVRGLASAAKKQPSLAQRPISEVPGYDFTDTWNPNIVGMLVIVDDDIRIATPYQPVLRRQSNLYILHDLEGYIEVCLAGDMVGTHSTAQINLDRAQYAIERLLPDGHEMKRPERKSDDARVDGRTVA